VVGCVGTWGGGWIRLVEDRSEMWIRASISSSTPTNAPNSVRLRTLPWILEPIGYLSARSCHGLLSTCFRPSEMRRAVASTPSTIALVYSRTLAHFDGLLTLLLP